jgi:hypothetical protein
VLNAMSDSALEVSALWVHDPGGEKIRQPAPPCLILNHFKPGPVLQPSEIAL